MVPGKGLFFVHRCTLLFSVEHIWIPTMPSFALRVTRLGLSGLARLSPKLAGKLAFKLFCFTPSRRPKGKKAQEVHAQGRVRLDAAERVMLTFPEGRAMAYR